MFKRLSFFSVIAGILFHLNRTHSESGSISCTTLNGARFFSLSVLTAVGKFSPSPFVSFVVNLAYSCIREWNEHEITWHRYRMILNNIMRILSINQNLNLNWSIEFNWYAVVVIEFNLLFEKKIEYLFNSWAFCDYYQTISLVRFEWLLLIGLNLLISLSIY